MTAADHDPDRPLEPEWAAPTGAASPDPDPYDDAERASPAPVTPLAGDAPVTGHPWIVRARTAAGVSGLSVEIEGRARNVSMRPEPATAGSSPTWTAVIGDIGTTPVRYRFVWRSSWTGDVTDWQTATPTALDDP